MGYSEVLCHICGVSFNIGRIRKPDEPRNAAWGRFCLPTTFLETYVDGGERNCHRDAGCMFTIRKLKDEHRMCYVDERGKKRLGKRTEHTQAETAIPATFTQPTSNIRSERGSEVTDDYKSMYWIAEDDDDDDDEDWIPEEDGDGDEPLEYVSDDELPDSWTRQEDNDVEMTDADHVQQNGLDQESLRQFWIQGLLEDEQSRKNLYEASERYPAWYRGAPSYVPSLQDHLVTDEMFPHYYPGRDDASEHGSDASFECTEHPESSHKWNAAKLNHWHYGKLGYHHEESRDVEHIAGPRCESRNGYSGHEISAEEMRGCQTAQCLVRKPRGLAFDLLPDDEDFEKNGEFFLSGLTDHMPSRDWGCPQFTPPRHGCDEPRAENCIWSEDEAYDYVLPFHPSCFEVFKHATLLSYGIVNVNALTSWWSLEAGFDEFHCFPRDPNVSRCAEQDWSHRNGTAYLVANPLFIPRLENILEAAIDASPNFSPHNCAFGVSYSNAQTKDPFVRLPAELQFEILDNLPSKDIASLRLSSRAFTQLPISYFQKLLLRELPWLWEAWPTRARPSRPMVYSSWATMTAYEAKIKLQKQNYELSALSDYVDIVKREMPELAPQVNEQFGVQYQAIMDAQERELILDEENRTPFFMPPDRTNYFTLYTLITRHWSELQGLQNRRRIWRDCEEILRRVEAYKKEGRIDENGITEDLRQVVTERNNREIEKRRRQDEERAAQRRLQASSNALLGNNAIS